MWRCPRTQFTSRKFFRTLLRFSTFICKNRVNPRQEIRAKSIDLASHKNNFTATELRGGVWCTDLYSRHELFEQDLLSFFSLPEFQIRCNAPNWLSNTSLPTPVSLLPKQPLNVTYMPKWCFRYIQGVLYPLLYTGASFNGTYLPGVLLGQGLLVGAPRIGTIRAEPVSCDFGGVYSFVGPKPEDCNPSFTEDKELKDDYGRDGVYRWYWRPSNVHAEKTGKNMMSIFSHSTDSLNQITNISNLMQLYVLHFPGSTA